MDFEVDLGPIPATAMEAMETWVEAVADDVGTAFVGATAVGGIAMQIRKWMKSSSASATAFQSISKQLPMALEQSLVQLHCLQRQAVEEIEALLPVEAVRKDMAARKATLKTAEKLALFDKIVIHRLASLVVWPVFIQFASNTMATEATLLLLRRAQVQADGAKGGGLMGLMINNLLAQLGTSGVQIAVECGDALLAGLPELCSLAVVAVTKALGDNFKCSERVTSVRLIGILRAGYKDVLLGMQQRADHLLKRTVKSPGPSTNEADAADLASIMPGLPPGLDAAQPGDVFAQLHDVAVSRSFLDLTGHVSGAMFEHAVATQVSPRVTQCQGFSSETNDAPAFQIATQLGPVLFALSDLRPEFPAATMAFCRALVRANAE